MAQTIGALTRMLNDTTDPFKRERIMTLRLQLKAQADPDLDPESVQAAMLKGQIARSRAAITWPPGVFQ